MKNEVSVIGLGVMGSALARALLRDGHRVTVWNRTSAKAEPLVRDGAVLAPSAASAVGASPIVSVCVEDYKVTRSILGTKGGRSLPRWPGAGAVEYRDPPGRARRRGVGAGARARLSRRRHHGDAEPDRQAGHSYFRIGCRNRFPSGVSRFSRALPGT